MSRLFSAILSLSLLAAPVLAEDAEAPAEDTASQEATTEENGNGISSPKKLSGMSILGNEETPKSLVIVPWKSSEMGDSINLSDTLDDRATPVDKEVFLREIRYYEIRKTEK